MFERFTTSAWTVVDQAVLDAGAMGSPELRTGHLLLALCADDGPAGRSLAEAGISEALVRTSLVEPDPTSHPLDREALLSLGIDLDDVRRVIEQNFGAGALDRAAPSIARRSRQRRLVESIGADPAGSDAAVVAPCGSTPTPVPPSDWRCAKPSTCSPGPWAPSTCYSVFSRHRRAMSPEPWTPPRSIRWPCARIC